MSDFRTVRHIMNPDGIRKQCVGEHPNGLSKSVLPRAKPIEDLLSDCNLPMDFDTLKNFLFKRKTTRQINAWLSAKLIDDKIHLSRYDTPFVVLREHNHEMIAQFVATNRDIIYHSQGLVSALMRWIPFSFIRHSKGVYKIDHTYALSKRVNDEINRLIGLPRKELKKLKERNDFFETHWYLWESVQRKQSPTYFQGIEYNVHTGECLNAKAEQEYIEIPEKRKQWRRNLALYKKGLKTRLKVGALDRLIEKVNKLNWKEKDIYLEDDKWIELLATCIDKQEFPKEILLGIALQFPHGRGKNNWGGTLTAKEEISRIDDIFKPLSKLLRIELGVFGHKKHQHNLGKWENMDNKNFVTPKQLLNNYEGVKK